MKRKLLGLILLAALISIAAIWLNSNEGAIQLAWENYQIETTSTFVVTAAITLFILIWFVISLCIWIFRLPGRLMGKFKHRNDQVVWQSLAQGFQALSNGDNAKALSHFKHAKRHKTKDALPLLNGLDLQITAHGNKHKTIESLSKRLLEDKISEPAALKQLALLAEQEGNTAIAISYLEQVRQKYPDLTWPILPLLHYRRKEGNWPQANELLEEAHRKKLLSTVDYKQAKATQLLEESKKEYANGNYKQALQLAKESVSLRENLIPALYLVAASMAKNDQKESAIRYITKTWKKHPHPQLSELLLRFHEESEAKSLFALAQSLRKANPNHPETATLYTELAIRSNEVEDAKTYLKDMVTHHPSKKLYQLLARLEETTNANASAVNQWLKLALGAPTDPLWQCQSCGYTQSHWTSLCTACEQFNSLHWQSPSEHNPSKNTKIPGFSPIALLDQA